MATTPVQTDLDFEKASKILNVMIDPVSSDPGSPVTGQAWYNTTSNRFKGYDGSNVFSLVRLDGTDTYTGLITFNPTGQTVPFAVASGKTDTVSNLNADRVDDYHAAEAATASTLAARDASGNVTVATPTSDGHAATKAYVDSIAAGQDWKDSCVVATTANITLSGTQTIDGVAVVADDRVLVKDQTTASENGIYVCAAGAWSRATDSDENAEVTSGLTTFIEEGTDNAGAGYTLTTTGTIVVGTTSLTFTRTSGGSVYTAGNGMVKSGTTFHFAQSASYTAGGIPYASGSTTIGFISAVASGKVLKSNGTGTVPLWASLDLTTDVGASVLPVANGGTGTATQFTQGSVIFAGASGVYSQDNAGLFFDAANNRLGVGSNSIADNLHVVGSGYFSTYLSINTTSHDARLHVKETAGLNSSGFVTAVEIEGAYGAASSNHGIGFSITNKAPSAGIYVSEFGGAGSNLIFTTATSYATPTMVERMRISAAGNVSIGDSVTASEKLTVGGNIRLADGAARSIIGPANEDLKIISSPNSTLEGIKWYVDGGTTHAAALFQTGNFGIGTGVSPAHILEVKHDSDAHIYIHRNSVASSDYGEISFGTSTGTLYHASIRGVRSDSGGANGHLAFLTQATTGAAYGTLAERMRIDSAGNIGISTADIEDWNSAYRAIEAYQSAIMFSNVSEGLWLLSNAWFDGTNYKYKSAERAAMHEMNNGAHVFKVAATGTLDANIAWTNALTINNDASISVSSTTLVTNLNADTVDGYQATALLDLANSTGDTDDISEGLTNLFYTDARARAAISSGDTSEISYSSGIIGLGTEAGRVKSGTIGDGTSTSLAFTHSLGTQDVIVIVYQAGSPYKQVFCGIEHTSTSAVTLNFNTAPALNSFKVVCVAANG